MVRVIFDEYRSGLAVPVEHVKGGYEEFVSVLLLVSRQVPRVGPYQMQQLMKRQRSLAARVKLLKEMRDFANETTARLRAVMTVS